MIQNTREGIGIL